VVLLIAAFVIIKATAPGKSELVSKVKMSDFPMTIGEWEGKDIPLPERDYEILGTKNLIMRDYKNARGDSINLYIIYSEQNRKTLHPPEICYSGGGASTITEKSVIPLTDSIKANRFAIDFKDSQQLVVYWFRSGNLNTYSYLQQQSRFVLDRTLGKKTSGAMIRVSATVKGKSQDTALALVKSFCREIEPLLDKYVP
jgi:EpsI family protein